MAGMRWVFLRGLARRKEHWGDFVERFRTAVPCDEVEAIDLCGNGTEREREVFGTIPEFTDDLRARSQLLKKGPVRVVAISLGGMVASDWVSRHPEELVSAHVINTSDRNQSPFWDRLNPAHYPSLLKLAVFGATPIERERTVLSIVSSLPAEKREQHAQAFAAIEPPTPKSFFRQVLAAAKFAPPQSKPTIPVVVINSRGDRLVSPACSERLSKAWGVSLHTHPWAGHDLPLDDPDWTLSKITETTVRA